MVKVENKNTHVLLCTLLAFPPRSNFSERGQKQVLRIAAVRCSLLAAGRSTVDVDSIAYREAKVVAFATGCKREAEQYANCGPSN
jgi:hypothetical protein